MLLEVYMSDKQDTREMLRQSSLATIREILKNDEW